MRQFSASASYPNLNSNPNTNANVKTKPLPNRQPDILPSEVVTASLDSSKPRERSHSETCPSKRPAIASVIASPTTPPATAPATPKAKPPKIAGMVSRPVSTEPKTRSGTALDNVLPLARITNNGSMLSTNIRGPSGNRKCRINMLENVTKATTGKTIPALRIISYSLLVSFNSSARCGWQSLLIGSPNQYSSPTVCCARVGRLDLY